MKWIILLLPLSALAVPTSDHPLPYPLEETRYCGEPARHHGGGIKRSTAVITAFKKQHPCPVTGLPAGTCSGWSVDHVIPLAVGGCDSVSNLQWLPNEIKSCAGVFCKDRWERKIYADPIEVLK
jgi:hypothetical protein